MKRYIILLFTILTILSCADPLGLHNQEAAKVTIVLENIPVTDGFFSLPGDYQTSQWDNTNTDVIIKSGKGTTEVITITKSNIEFSLVPTDSWERPWYPEMKANYYDYGSNGKQWNFQILGLPLGQDLIITIDGSATPATVTVE